MIPQTDIQIAHPDIVFYDFYGAWDNPIKSDTEAYLSKFSYYLVDDSLLT